MRMRKSEVAAIRRQQQIHAATMSVLAPCEQRRPDGVELAQASAIALEHSGATRSVNRKLL